MLARKYFTPSNTNPFCFAFSALVQVPRAQRESPKFKKRLEDWLARLKLRFDCSHPDALDHCKNEEDAEWLRRVRANLPASMGSRDVIFQKKMEKTLKRKAEDEQREANAREKWNRESQVSLSLTVCVGMSGGARASMFVVLHAHVSWCVVKICV